MLNNISLAPSFINYFSDSENEEGYLEYVIGTEESDPEVSERFNKFRIRAGAETENKYSIDINLQDLKDIAVAAEKDIEIKFRTLKVCQGGQEANIVVLCSQAFTE